MKRNLKNSYCLHCFFEIQNALKKKSTHFENQYKTQPIFKAGLHYGKVIAGEIGVIKRDIAYSGDVLNTTARIQSKCNDFGVLILLSKALLQLLSPLNKHFISKQVGEVLLRGKEKPVELHTLSIID